MSEKMQSVTVVWWFEGSSLRGGVTKPGEDRIALTSCSAEWVRKGDSEERKSRFMAFTSGVAVDVVQDILGGPVYIRPEGLEDRVGLIGRDGSPPCGECHIGPGETCDICGRRHL